MIAFCPAQTDGNLRISLNTGLPGTPISQLEYILREVFCNPELFREITDKRSGLIMGMTLTWSLLTLGDHKYSCLHRADREESKDAYMFFPKQMLLLFAALQCVI